MTHTIHSKYVHIQRAQVDRMTYADGSLALVAKDLDEYENETLSVNLSDYGLVPPPGHIHVRAYGHHEGLAEALEEAGVAKIIERFVFGPHSTAGVLMEVMVP